MTDTSRRLRVYADTRSLFHLPEGVTYLDGNSLGALPVGVMERLARVVTQEWGDELIRAWNTAGWFEQPRRTGERIARLIGAEPGSVTMGDTLSIKAYQALAAALELSPDRRVILSDTGNFPTDLYMAEGLIRTLGRGHELRLVAPEAVESALGEEVAVLYLTEVDYRTGRRHDMAALGAKARALGVLTVWDLAHSAGALPVDLSGVGADFAAGCTYKYLNGGPGAPAFIYVAPRHGEARAALAGWMGHARPFAFDLRYAPAGGIERMRIGTPPVLALAALDASLDIFERVDIAELRQRSLDLTALFMSQVERRSLPLRAVTPRDPGSRGSQVSFDFGEAAYPAVQALIARGVIGDFRAPSLMRFGVAPLYVGEADILRAVDEIEDVVRSEAWRRPQYNVVNAVT